MNSERACPGSRQMRSARRLRGPRAGPASAGLLQPQLHTVEQTAQPELELLGGGTRRQLVGHFDQMRILLGWQRTIKVAQRQPLRCPKSSRAEIVHRLLQHRRQRQMGSVVWPRPCGGGRTTPAAMEGARRGTTDLSWPSRRCKDDADQHVCEGRRSMAAAFATQKSAVQVRSPPPARTAVWPTCGRSCADFDCRPTVRSFYRLPTDDLEELRKLAAMVQTDELELYLIQQVRDEVLRNRGNGCSQSRSRWRVMRNSPPHTHRSPQLPRVHKVERRRKGLLGTAEQADRAGHRGRHSEVASR